MSVAECPVCEREFEDPQDRAPELRGSAENRLATHLRNSADDDHREYREAMSPEPEFSQDEAPEPKRPPGRPKGSTNKAKATPKPAAGGFTLAQQLELPYHLLGDMARTRMPQTSMALHVNAQAAAQAWDRFLMRYPSLRDKIQNGMIGADVLALVMVHVEILRVAREEMTAQRLQMEHYEGGLETAAA